MSGVAPLVIVLALAAAPPTQPAAFERRIEVQRPGRVAAALDRDVYERAREDLDDLRVRDDHAALVPFLLDRGDRTAPRAAVPAAVRNHGWLGDGALSAVLDFGSRVPRTRLRLTLSGANFRRRVSVSGSEDGETWTTLVDEAWVFAVPGKDPARFETVSLPEDDFPLLRVVVHPGEGESGRVSLLAAELPAQAEPPRREQLLRPQWTRGEVAAAHETWLTLDLGARHQPFHALELSVEDKHFFRDVRVEARRDGGGTAIRWVEIGRGALYRLDHDGRMRECLRLDVRGRERVLRVRIPNGDDRPLDVRGLVLRAPVERVVFEASAGRSYTLTYGGPWLGPPAFDLPRIVEDPGAWSDAAEPARLAAAQRAAGVPEPARPWTERHPALLWTALVAVVLILGALTVRALKTV